MMDPLKDAPAGYEALLTQLVEEGVVLQVGLLRGGSSGYPLNGYVCAQRPIDLELVAGADVSASVQQGLAVSVLAVLVTVYDGETFVAALPNELNELSR